MLVWPLPALLTWSAAWALLLGLPALGWPLWAAFGVAQGGATAAAAAAALRGATRWRQALLAAGFPLSLLASGSVGLPAWAWLLAGLLLLGLYPLRSWRDAPLFPTPALALQGLAACARLPPGARLVDAGCGLGAGLQALRGEYPLGQINGLEWSWPLRLLCGWRCRFATVRRADIWRADWSGYDLVYLFQRPESMARAMAKANTDMKPGSWLVSLEFEATGWQADHRLETVPGKPVWLYRLPALQRPQPPTRPLRIA